MRQILLVAAGGAIGAVARYLVGVAFSSRGATGFPYHTLVVNLLGAFLLGVLATLVSEKELLSPEALLLLGTGVLGGFTTFSTLAYETVVLAERGAGVAAFANAAGTMVAGLAAAWIGVMAGRAL